MLQVKKGATGPFKIKSIRKKTDAECTPSSSCCSGEADNGTDKPPCCGPPTSKGGGLITDKVPGFIAWLDTPAGPVPRIATELGRGDRFGACKARWGIGRMEFIVPPGLYAVGHPSATDPVLVTANYKMSYDLVRKSLSGRNIWLLVLETFGVNVWCAAGKGTFGTGELVRRVASSGLTRVVSHRRLILPILGAPGVAAHEVARRTGFKVSYATIRAADLPEYLDNGMITTPAMQEMTFSFYERLVLVPVELVMGLKSVAIIGAVTLLLIAVLGGVTAGISGFCAYLGAVLSGIVLGPLLLPWLPGKSFAVKGAFAGLLWSGFFYLLAGGSNWNGAVTAAFFLALPAVSAFHTLNFTGCSTYTSRSGVKKEMRIALPTMGGALIASLILLLAGRFL
ncbi:MAG TPA: mercury methylation corrinoid protein HgcA [Dongiaceae bacterium]|nr:mercury methylation corrinoid protein HgcA [Dongiaceae bacterium]